MSLEIGSWTAADGPSALVTQDRLVAAVTRVAKRSLESPKVKAALAAAESIPLGIVLSNEDATAGVVDNLRTIIDAEKALAADLQDILRIPKAMEAAARQAMQKTQAELTSAKLRGNDARVAWQQEVRRRAAAAEAKAREDARKATEAAAVAALEMGEDAPPEPEVAPIVVPRTVTAGKASSGTTVRIQATEIVDDAACPKAWKTIVRALAEGYFRQAETLGTVKRAAPGESVVWCGVRFVSVESVVNR